MWLRCWQVVLGNTSYPVLTFQPGFSRSSSSSSSYLFNKKRSGRARLGHSFCNQLRTSKGLHIAKNNAGLTCKDYIVAGNVAEFGDSRRIRRRCSRRCEQGLTFPKKSAPKSMKIAVDGNPTIVWRPQSKEPPRISEHTIYYWKLDSWPTFLPLTVWVYLYSHFSGGLQKTHLFWHRVLIGRSRSTKVDNFVTNRKRVCDFLLVRHCEYGPILHRFWDTETYWLKTAYFSYPSLIRRPGISRWRLPRGN